LAIETGYGEELPFPDGRFDIVYARQVLHHARELRKLLRECARVTASSGTVIATREHVADDAAQLEAFLASHPVHRLAGGEHAYSLTEYRHAFTAAGLRVVLTLGPLDSVVNAFPAFTDDETLRRLPVAVLEGRFGRAGHLFARIPGVAAVIRRMMDRPVPGRLYTLVARKP
jgi:SAM-dependent methyltransferase